MYIKIDSKVTNRFEIEQLIKGCKSGNSPLLLSARRLSRGSFELERLSQIATAHQRHHRLQIVAGLTGHADLFTLNLGLHFQLAVFDQFNDLLLHRAFNALLQLRFNKPCFTAVHDIFRYVEGGAFNAALEQLGAKDIQQLVHRKSDSLSTLMVLLASFNSKVASTPRKSKRDSTSRLALSTALRAS